MSETNAGGPGSAQAPVMTGPPGHAGPSLRASGDTLASDFDVVDFLQRLSTDSVEILGAEAAGVMLADPRGGLRLIASSDERMRLLELFELQGAQGPCLDAFSSGQSIQASAADSRARWPVFAPEASDAGFQMMCAVPLRIRTNVIGALNLFRGTDEPFTGAEMDLAQAMAEMAAIGLIQERALRERSLRAEQLQAALNSRVVIEQAKGMLAEYLTMNVDDAFKLPRNYARNHNRKLGVLASDTAERKIPIAVLARRPGGPARNLSVPDAQRSEGQAGMKNVMLMALSPAITTANQRARWLPHQARIDAYASRSISPSSAGASSFPLVAA